MCDPLADSRSRPALTCFSPSLLKTVSAACRRRALWLAPGLRISFLMIPSASASDTKPRPSRSKQIFAATAQIGPGSRVSSGSCSYVASCVVRWRSSSVASSSVATGRPTFCTMVEKAHAKTAGGKRVAAGSARCASSRLPSTSQPASRSASKTMVREAKMCAIAGAGSRDAIGSSR